MKFRRESREPLWKDEVSHRAADERYVTRRQFVKFTVLGSLGMFAGNVWILLRSWLREAPTFSDREIARVDDLDVGDVRQFQYPGPRDPCLLVRLDRETFVAYSQKCTHLSCAVYYDRANGQIECPCHDGSFSARTGAVLRGPPPRPLVRIDLARRGDRIVAVGVDAQEDG